MNKYEELVYSLIYNCNRELTTEENKILNQASAIYNTYNNLSEQIGCPLEVLNYKEVNYIRDNEQSYGSVLGINIQHKTIMIGSAWSFMKKPLNQFGKTWWLKENKE